MPKLLSLIIICLLVLFTETGSIFAQQPTGFETLSTAQGLSQGMVFDILQDKEGFIWVATKNGLNRYDGYNFKVFTNDPYNKNSLSSNTITTLYEDSKGNIWVGTDNGGINVYNKANEKFYRIVHDPGNVKSLSGDRIKNCIIEMSDGRMLVAAEDRGFNIIELPADFFKKESAPVITRMSLPNNEQVYAIGKDVNENNWICGVDKSVYQFKPADYSFIPQKQGSFLSYAYVNDEGNIWTTAKFFLREGDRVTPLFNIKKFPGGNILLQTKAKLWQDFHEQTSYYDLYKWRDGKPAQLGEKLEPASTAKILFPFLYSRSGILWVGTKGYGLRKYNLLVSKFNSAVPGFSVRFILPDTENGILLGAYPYEWRVVNNEGVEKNPLQKISSNKYIDNVLIARNGNYWIWTDDAGLFQYSKTTNKITTYPSLVQYAGKGDKQPMLEDSKGYIWISKLSGEFARVNPESGAITHLTINNNPAKPMLPRAGCTALYEDGLGVFWIGSEEGFARLELRKNEHAAPLVTWYRNSTQNRSSLNYNYVSCLLDDPGEPNKYLWVCTKGGGLNRLNKTTGDFIHLTTKDGLPNDVVYGIMADDAGNIWGSTNRGIFCMISKMENQKTVYSFRNFTKADGLQDDEFNTSAYAKLPNGNLAFGGVNGLNTFSPSDVLSAGFIPNVFITNILVNNQGINAGDNTGLLTSSIEQSKQITLNYLQDILTLEFSALDFTAPNQNKYRYQLVGIDEDWVESGTRRTATYLHLPDGKYNFKVQGSNSHGTWSNKLAELEIKVLPPWWRTWWAYAVYALLIALAIRAYFKFSVNKAKLQSQLSFNQLEAKRAKELDVVKTQLYTNITHEFRTPLTVILGMAQQVIDKPGVHYESGMAMIMRNGQSLLNLVNEMLDLAKLETGKMELHLVKADVISFLRYIIESFHSLAESQQKQLHFLSEIDSLYLSFDQEKLRQIVFNLLSNALKFTPEKGNIYITVLEHSPTPDGQKTTLIIKVKDTGIGIPEEQLQHIFDRFYQLDNSHTRKTEGTGIGLALTKELVKLMAGEIVVKSPATGANNGTEFIVTLPLKKVSNNNKDIIHNKINGTHHIKAVPLKQGVSEVGCEPDPSEKPLILLVEDHADVVAYTASCLPDYRLAVAKDGREGFEVACQLIPNLVITDVMMPFVDGFELCRKLRKDEHTSHIPIIMLTAKADMESKLDGLQQGADVYLEKPFNKEELLVRIKKLLEIRQSLQAYYLKKAGLVQNLAAPQLATAAVLTDSIREDEFVKKIITVIEDNLVSPTFSVEQLCKLVFMSHSQLHRKLEALTGCSPNKFIRIIRLHKAKELLQIPGKSIASVAMDCGYNDPGYFARVFKQEYQVTPQEWRSNS